MFTKNHKKQRQQKFLHLYIKMEYNFPPNIYEKSYENMKNSDILA